MSTPITGSSIMKQICDLLNIEQESERIILLKINVPIDGLVTVEKEFECTKRHDISIVEIKDEDDQPSKYMHGKCEYRKDD